MNEVMKNILTRRSIRKYKAEQLKEEDLKIILEAGRLAPSAMNLQPWHFTVVQNKTIIDEMGKDIAKVMQAKKYTHASAPGFHTFFNAPSVILICGEETSSFAYVDCALAAENMMLAAHSIGAGTCFIAGMGFLMGTEEREFYLQKLGVPKGYLPFYSIAVGYPQDTAEMPVPKRKTDIVTLIK
ncbi:nitroreductase [Elusimicrobium simillimum]|uniref:nitroreductase family protein n=1 Tax=Elusimicrobium simillimum TaxID=3143438 RepID=UPI003C6F6E00